MGTPTTKDKTAAPRHAFPPAAALPAPYQFAIESAAFHMTVLDDHVARDCECDCALMSSTWFSVTLTASTQKRYLYLVQHETDTDLVVLLLLFDRSAGSCDSDGLRLPPTGAWLRAIVEGSVYVLATDLALNRKAITAWLGGREPPTIPAQPPYI